MTKASYTTAIALALTAWVAAPAAQAQTFMTEDEMLASLPGVQVNGTSQDGVAWAQAYSKRSGTKKDGIFNGVYGSDKYTGTWAIRNGQWCEETSDGWQGCFNFVRDGDKALISYRDGKKRGTWKIK